MLVSINNIPLAFYVKQRFSRFGYFRNFQNLNLYFTASITKSRGCQLPACQGKAESWSYKTGEVYTFDYEVETTSGVWKDVFGDRKDVYNTKSILKSVVKITKTSQCHYMMEVS